MNKKKREESEERRAERPKEGKKEINRYNSRVLDSDQVFAAFAELHKREWWESLTDRECCFVRNRQNSSPERVEDVILLAPMFQSPIDLTNDAFTRGRCFVLSPSVPSYEILIRNGATLNNL